MDSKGTEHRTADHLELVHSNKTADRVFSINKDGKVSSLPSSFIHLHNLKQLRKDYNPQEVDSMHSRTIGVEELRRENFSISEVVQEIQFGVESGMYKLSVDKNRKKIGNFRLITLRRAPLLDSS
jgi:hypothetical protein